MAYSVYSGSGIVAAADEKAVKWTGKTKDGKSVEISFQKAINMGNIDWAFAEKDDTCAEIVFTALYTNTDAMALTNADLVEPWQVKVEDGVSGAGEASKILLGAGKLSIGGTDVALTRGGGQFTVEREFRQINADGDRGPVSGRVVMDGSVATLKVTALQFLTRVADVYAGITATTSTN